MNPVIYKATNTLDGKCYVGQTINLTKRKREHLSNSNTHNDEFYFHRAIRKHGWSNFNWEVLCECTEVDLDTQEKYWVKYWDSFGPNGYNMVAGGGGRRGYTATEETKRRISKSKLGVKIGAQDKTLFKFEHLDGRVEICTKYDLIEKYNLNRPLVTAICNGKRKRTGGWIVIKNTK